MTNEAKVTELSQAEEMAYFRADLCPYSPEIYSLGEKKEICNDMMSTSKAVLDAMREDFERLPPDVRAKLLSRRPCGTCNPCKDAMNEGMRWRMPLSFRLRCHVRRLNTRFYKARGK